ncbi:bacterial transcriptional activator domain-containing protein [Parafrankia sp. FMc6]|uniref:AfsR/SARP family transcriptional regulator n=1 Tax=Parafrankia soli TaxID=2599596 RepID=UPI0034D3E47D
MSGSDRGSRDLATALSRTECVRLAGPGAQGAARALLTAALLAPADGDHPLYRVVTTQTDLDALDLAGLDPRPDLIITASLATALRHLSGEVLHRSWLTSCVANTAGAALPRTVQELRAALPEEQLPGIVLLTTEPQAAGPALAALLSHGAAYGLGAVLVADHVRPGVIKVAADGSVTAAGDALHRFRTLTAPAAKALLQPRPVPAGAPTEADQGGTGRDSEITYPLTAYSPAPPPTLPAPPTRHPVLASGSVPTEQPARTEPPTERPVYLHLFGPPRLVVQGSPLSQGLRARAVELMAYLAVHPDGARTGTIIADLLPDAEDETRAKNLIYTVIGSLRDLLRTATGQSRTWFIERTTNGYKLDDTLIDVDLWQIRAALTTAATTPDAARRCTAVTTALARTGARRFLDQVTWEWADSHVLTVHHRLLDASRRLATDLAARGDTDQALAVLHDALAIDPYAEDLYQQLLRIHAARGDQPALHRVYELLRTRLEEITTRPSRASVDLYTHLMRGPHPADRHPPRLQP